jgi:uncharacterized membrane protein YoaK (UPF0700 family)
MFGPHDSLSAERGAHFVATRAFWLSAPLLTLLAALPMLLVLLPLAFAGLPFLVVSFLSGASNNRFETRRIRAWQAVAQPA